MYETAEIDNEKPELLTLACSYGKADAKSTLEGENNHLQIVLHDEKSSLRLYLDYYVFEDENVISRTSRLVNYGDKPVVIKKLMSAQIDMQGSGYIMSTFNGTWAREMMRRDTPLVAGKHINSSFTGTSSSDANPFFMISTPHTTEDAGAVYGFNLIYSGNHAEIAEVNEFDKTRILWGINPRGFGWYLEGGAEFEAPEAVITFSDKGFNQMSVNMHRFIRKHVIRPEFADKERPILLNSWEAAYFDINEKKLLKLLYELLAHPDGDVRRDLPLEETAALFTQIKDGYDAGRSGVQMDFNMVRKQYQLLYSLIRTPKTDK